MMFRRLREIDLSRADLKVREEYNYWKAKG